MVDRIISSSMLERHSSGSSIRIIRVLVICTTGIKPLDGIQVAEQQIMHMTVLDQAIHRREAHLLSVFATHPIAVTIAALPPV